MGTAVLVLGQSGTGKSTSLRNFKSDEITLFNVAGKPLPFKGRFRNTICGDSYEAIKKGLSAMETKIAVVDDSQYLMANEFMRRGLERGYDKFTEIAMNYWELIDHVNSLPYDVRVYFLSHIDTDANGDQKVKTIGKMLDEKITVEGMFSIVLKTQVKDGMYSFVTQNNGHDTVKSPVGMFKTFEIPNDLKAVDAAISEYYELDTPIANDAEEIKNQDKGIEIPEVEKTEDVVEQLKEKYEVEPESQPEEKTEEAPIRRQRRKRE